MTTRHMAIIALLGIGCVSAEMPASAQPGPGRGPQGPANGASMRGPYTGNMPPSGYGASRYTGAPTSGYQSAPAMSGRSSIPSTRFSTVPDNSRTYGGSTSQPPFQSSQSIQRSPRSSTPPDTSRVQQALRQKDYEAMGVESQNIHNRVKDLPQMGPEMSPQDRLKMPLLQHKYRQGLEMIDEGRNTRNEMKVQYGIQQIEDADKRVNRMDDRGGSGRSSRGPR